MSLPGIPNGRSLDGFWHDFFHVPTIVWGLIWAVTIAGVIEVIRRKPPVITFLRPEIRVNGMILDKLPTDSVLLEMADNTTVVVLQVTSRFRLFGKYQINRITRLEHITKQGFEHMI